MSRNIVHNTYQKCLKFLESHDYVPIFKGRVDSFFFNSLLFVILNFLSEDTDLLQ